VLARRVRGKEPWPGLTVVDKAFIVRTLIHLVSSVVAVAPERTLRMTVQFVFLFGIAHFTIHYLRSEAEARLVLFATFLSGGLAVGYGVVQLAGGFAGINTHLLLRWLPENPTMPTMLTVPGAVYFPGAGRHVVRVSSTFFDWNYFGGYLVVLLCLTASLLLYRHRRRGRRLHLAAFGLTAAVLLVFTFSRSAWIGSLAAAAVLFWLCRAAFRARELRLWVGGGLVLIVLMNFAMGNPARLAADRLAFMFRGDPSVAKHGIYGRAALEMFYESPLLGIGLHNFAAYYQQAYDGSDAGATAHSTFLTYFAETGILGGLGHLFFHGLAIWLMAGAIRRSERFSFDRLVLSGCLAAYAGVLACNVFYFFSNQAFIWTLAGYGLGHARLVTHWDRTFAIGAQVKKGETVMVPGS